MLSKIAVRFQNIADANATAPPPAVFKFATRSSKQLEVVKALFDSGATACVGALHMLKPYLQDFKTVEQLRVAG